MSIAPMKATSGDLPPDDGTWHFEVKWDGMRAIARIEGDSVHLFGGRGNDVTVGYPELEGPPGIPAAVGVDCVLDGEVVAFSDRGTPSFGRLQHRMHVTDADEAARRAADVPVVYVAFDLLSVDGRPTDSLPYLERRALLDEVVRPSSVLHVPPSYPSGGADLLEAARRQGLEGVVAKRIDSTYRPGRRSPSWRKIKVRHTQELVVGGWVEGSGARSSSIGSLVLGCHRDGGLVWVGNVGTGFSDAELRRLGALLLPAEVDEMAFVVGAGAERPTGPAGRRLRWVRPEVVVQVEFGEWTEAGRLRHPVYLGQRDDKLAVEVTCDP